MERLVAPPQWRAAVEAWKPSQQAAQVARTTIALRRRLILGCGARIGIDTPWAVDGATLVDWVGSRDWQPDTRATFRSAARVFWGWGCERGYTHIDAGAALPRIKGREPNPRPTPEPAFSEAREIDDKRVRLMVRLAGEMGLRRAEVAAVHARDILRQPQGWVLCVHGKGGKDRYLPLPDDLAGEMLAACPERGYLFPGGSGGHLSPHWVGLLVAKTLPDGYTMHTLRHRFGSMAYALTSDLATVQDFLGHSNPATTRRYVRVPDERLRKAAELVADLHLPV